jgi:hypothetical protein
VRQHHASVLLRRRQERQCWGSSEEKAGGPGEVMGGRSLVYELTAALDRERVGWLLGLLLVCRTQHCNADAADAHQPRDHAHPSRDLGVVLEQLPSR